MVHWVGEIEHTLSQNYLHLSSSQSRFQTPPMAGESCPLFPCCSIYCLKKNQKPIPGLYQTQHQKRTAPYLLSSSPCISPANMRPEDEIIKSKRTNMQCNMTKSPVCFLTVCRINTFLSSIKHSEDFKLSSNRKGPKIGGINKRQYYKKKR
jgi:hypothetical protein